MELAKREGEVGQEVSAMEASKKEQLCEMKKQSSTEVAEESSSLQFSSSVRTSSTSVKKTQVVKQSTFTSSTSSSLSIE